MLISSFQLQRVRLRLLQQTRWGDALKLKETIQDIRCEMVSTPLTKSSQIGSSPPARGETKNCLKPPPNAHFLLEVVFFLLEVFGGSYFLLGTVKEIELPAEMLFGRPAPSPDAHRHPRGASSDQSVSPAVALLFRSQRMPVHLVKATKTKISP